MGQVGGREDQQSDQKFLAQFLSICDWTAIRQWVPWAIRWFDEKTYKVRIALTLYVPIVTNSNFLLTMSVHCQEIRLWEYKKWSRKRECLDVFFNFSQLIVKGNVWRSVWRICMWILGLKGLKACTAKKKVVYFPVRLFFTSNRL